MINRRRFIAGMGAVAAAGLLNVPFIPKAHGTNVKSKTLLIGMDGLDPLVLAELMKEGRLPNFTALANQGGMSPLATSIPPQSPVAWSCIGTGMTPAGTNVFDFLRRDPSNYLPELGLYKINNGLMGVSYESVVKAKGLWELFYDAGVPATMLRWPMAFPASENSGRLLGGLGVPDIKGGLGNYTFYTDKQPPAGEEGREKCRLVNLRDNRAEALLEGPVVAGFTGRKPSTIKMKIETMPSAGRVRLSIDGSASFELGRGQWSDWVRLAFSIDPFRKVRAICRFHLSSLAPFGLYVTPLQIDPKNPATAISHPEKYAAELANKVGDYATLGMPEDTKALTEGRIDEAAFIEMCDSIFKSQEDLFYTELEDFKEGLLGTVFFSTDRINHIFWVTRDPEHPMYDEAYAKEYGNVIPQYYEKADKVLGRAMQKADDNTLVLACSDHGFASFRQSAHLNTWLVDNGFMELTFRPPADDRQGGPLFKYVDWKRTRAYALGLNSVFINLQDREGKGVVSRKDYQNVVRELASKLEGFMDPESGKPVVAKAFEVHSALPGADRDSAPDIIVGFNRGYRMSWQTAIGGTPASGVLEPNMNKWTGDHCMAPSQVPGILVMNRAVASKEPAGLDITPTVLAQHGIPAKTDGKPF